MHDGSLATLDDVYDFYAQVDRDRDPGLSNIGAVVGSARKDLTAFLESLTDESFDDATPDTVPSELPPGGSRRRLLP